MYFFFEQFKNNAFKITLLIAEKNSDIWKMEQWINKDTKLIDKVIMHSRNASTYTYAYLNNKINQNLTDDLFICDPKKETKLSGYFITDLRE